MLTSEQSIVEFNSGKAFPDRLTQNTHRHYTEYGEKMLSVYRDGAGKQRLWLHRQIESIFADEPNCPVRRIQAFCKLLDDASVYKIDSEGQAAKLRLKVFGQASHFHPLVEQPDRLFESDQKEVKAQLAQNIGLSWEQIEQNLYCDVIEYQRLEKFEGYENVQTLLSRYNVAQLQACLYRAENMIIQAHEDFKTILRYAKLAHLLHKIQRIDKSKYRITLTGPASVLHESRRYGVSFARFLPALLACKGWEMTALVKTPWKRPARLILSDKDDFTSHLPSSDEFDSSIEENFAAKFGDKYSGWQLIREGEIIHNYQKTFVPDFTFRHEDGTEVLMEIVGFWTPEYLESRRETLKQFKNEKIIIVIQEKSLRTGAKIPENFLIYKTTIKLAPLLEILEKFRSNQI